MDLEQNGSEMLKILIIDVDGTLVEYPKHFEDYVFKMSGYKAELNELKKLYYYDVLKQAYRTSGIKRDLPLLNDKIPIILKELKNKYQIWIVTARSNLYSGVDTIYWLDKNEIYYDNLFFVSNKNHFISSIKNIHAIIDDDIELLNLFINTDIKTILINKNNDWDFVINYVNTKRI